MERVKDWFQEREEEFLRDLENLVRYPSVSQKGEGGYPYGEACRNVLREALACAERFGLTVRNFQDHCGTARVLGRTEHTIGLFAHLDVVPAGEGWSYEPYEMTVKNGMLYGRGCADDKGPAMMALYALRYLAESGRQLRHSLCLFLGCDEETGMEDVEYYLKREENPPAFSLVADGSFSVCVGEKGHIVFKASRPLSSPALLSFSAGLVPNSVPATAEAVLRLPAEAVERALGSAGVPFQVFPGDEDGTARVVVRGRAAHAAFPEGSLHAQKQMARLLCASGLLDPEAEQALQGVAAFLADDYGTGMGIGYETPEFGRLTMVSGVTRLEKGRLAMTFDVRSPMGFQEERAKEKAARRLGAYGFALESWSYSPGYYRDPSSPAIQAMKGIAERVWSRELPLYVMGGGTYARKIPHAVPFGPGLPRSPEEADSGKGRAHQPDEGIRLEVLQKGMEIYVEALLALDGILD